MRGWLAAVVAAMLGVVVLAAVLLASRSDESTAPPPRRPLSVQTSITPQPAFFGDLVTARAEVLVDRTRIDPDRIEVNAEFAPYALDRAPLRSRSDGERLTSLEYRFVLSCLAEGCLPRAAGLALPQLRVRAPLRAGGTSSVVTQWPRLAVSSRVDEREESASPVPWRLELGLPALTARISPRALTALLVAVAATLALGAFALVGVEIARARRLRRERARSRLERALALARQAAGRAPADRRKALAHLAHVLTLEPNGNGRLADDATRLAWARPDPPRERVEALVADVEQAVTTP